MLPSRRHRTPRPAPVSILSFLLLCSTVGAPKGPPGPCGGGEWRCGSGDRDEGTGRCISLNKFCDGIENCEDGSDEPLGCTNCNRTFFGEANIKFPLRVTGPFQRYLPFVCKIAFVAAGKEFGDFVEITFLSFQIGRLELTRNQTSVCQKGHLRISELADDSKEWDDTTLTTYRQHGRYSSTFPRQPSEEPPRVKPEFGEFCGSMIERSVTFFSQSNNVTVTAVVPSRASIPSTSFGLYLTYRFLKRLPASGDDFFPPGYTGEPVPGTYCDREYLDCHAGRRCRIRTPNFPGFYPRNVTCNYFIRQPKTPKGYLSRIVLSQPNDYKISVPTGRPSSTSSTNFLLSTDCLGGDSVSVFDGPSVRSPQILEFCGSGSLPEVVSSGSDVLVQIRSAPYQHLSNSRVEIEAAVKFEAVQTEAVEDDGRCSYTLDGTKRRWGIIHSPRHTMPPNANCTYRFIGASKQDKVWIYFVSFFVLEEKRPPSLSQESSCAVSKLEIHDLGISASNNTGSSSSSSEPTYYFCGETGPRICAHAADYPPKYLPPRPCEVPSESYLTSGSEVLIKHRFLSFASELLSSSTSSFTARYEFIDTSQDGSPIDHSLCDRRFDSRLSKTGTFSNPKNTFLYGRGGRQNLTCMYHFVGLPNEKVKVTILRTRLNKYGSLCSTRFNNVLQRYACLMSTWGNPDGHAVWSKIGVTEHWDGHSSPIGCFCDVNVDSGHPPVVMESLVGNVKMIFDVVGMSHLEDFEDFFFEASYEFLNDTMCNTGLRRQSGMSGEGILSFRVPVKSTNAQQVVPQDPPRPLRCRWQIEASPHKHLFLKFKGLNASTSEECRLGIRLLVYLDPRAKPVANACVDDDRLSLTTEDVEEFDIFSHTWYNESRERSFAGDRDRLFIEIVAPPQDIHFVIHWLEVTRPFVRTQSGQTMRNVDCLFECPEIGACIDPELWCDGVVHCPSGLDESPDHCRHFPVTYVACSVAAVVLSLMVGVWVTIRRRHFRKRLKKKVIRKLPPHDYCVESPVG